MKPNKREARKADPDLDSDDITGDKRKRSDEIEGEPDTKKQKVEKEQKEKKTKAKKKKKKVKRKEKACGGCSMVADKFSKCHSCGSIYCEDCVENSPSNQTSCDECKKWNCGCDESEIENCDDCLKSLCWDCALTCCDDCGHKSCDNCDDNIFCECGNFFCSGVMGCITTHKCD